MLRLQTHDTHDTHDACDTHDTADPFGAARSARIIVDAA
jgi:hypothetical protein